MILQAASVVGAYLSNDTWSRQHVPDTLKWMLYHENKKRADYYIIVTVNTLLAHAYYLYCATWAISATFENTRDNNNNP